MFNDLHIVDQHTDVHWAITSMIVSSSNAQPGNTQSNTVRKPEYVQDLVVYRSQQFAKSSQRIAWNFIKQQTQPLRDTAKSLSTARCFPIIKNIQGIFLNNLTCLLSSRSSVKCWQVLGILALLRALCHWAALSHYCYLCEEQSSVPHLTRSLPEQNITMAKHCQLHLGSVLAV